MNLNRVLVDVESKTAWVEAGLTLRAIYYEVSRASSHFGFPAGLYPTIGSGGHIGGGGWGLKSRKYGLASDNVVDAILVYSNGRLLDRQMMGEDVFWAIRGGGPRSFGAVYSWKISLVDVPDKFVAPKLEDEVTLLALIRSEPDATNMVATFLGLYLGPKHATLASINGALPELSLHGSECNELSWIESMAYFLGILGMLMKKPRMELALSPFGGIMSRIKSDMVPFPHRKGNLYILGYFVYWDEKNEKMSSAYMDSIQNFHEYITLFVSKIPRASYVNEIDLDLGVMDWENVSMSGDELVEVGRAWGNSLGDVKASLAPEFVPREDWVKFIDYCNSEKFLNKENRAKLIAAHTLGRTSMPITRHKLAEERGVTDEEIGRVEVYIPAYTKNDKTIQCPDVIKFGKERKGGTRGMGVGMSISLVEKVGHIVSENEELLSNNNELKFATEKLRKDLDALTKYVGNIPVSYVFF
ncbi:hypothetical protein GIB67_032166 [Kingdonia uniflora]|uniref:FAD-binding PCMH-type domain-containing protein n=1 Tax=Kingdonia uniflora TaxID=39325 RepID=A0A7J7MWU8_9MAGN|nr:hypothetical protein GIB67_032166 [Kingdonia uniflora]